MLRATSPDLAPPLPPLPSAKTSKRPPFTKEKEKVVRKEAKVKNLVF